MCVSCMRACLHIVDCTKSDTCAEKEYRERDSSCEVKLRLPTVAAAAATECGFLFLSSTKRNKQRLHTNPEHNASQPSIFDRL